MMRYLFLLYGNELPEPGTAAAQQVRAAPAARGDDDGPRPRRRDAADRRAGR